MNLGAATTWKMPFQMQGYSFTRATTVSLPEQHYSFGVFSRRHVVACLRFMVGASPHQAVVTFCAGFPFHVCTCSVSHHITSVLFAREVRSCSASLGTSRRHNPKMHWGENVTVECQPPLVDLCCDNHQGLVALSLQVRAPEKFLLEKAAKHLLCHTKKSASYTLALLQCTNGNTVSSVLVGGPVSTKTSICVRRPSQDQSCYHLPKRSPVVAAE